MLFLFTVDECDRALLGARIKRAELKAFGISNTALESINRHIDRILDRRTVIAELNVAERDGRPHSA